MNKIYCGYVFALLLTIGLPLLAGVLGQGGYPGLFVLGCLFVALIALSISYTRLCMQLDGENG